MYILICIALCKILYVICTSHEIAKYGIDFVQNQMHHQHGSPEMMTNGENCFINTVCVPYFNSCMCELYVEFALCNGVEVYMALCALSLKYCVLFFGALIYFRKKKKLYFITSSKLANSLGNSKTVVQITCLIIKA